VGVSFSLAIQPITQIKSPHYPNWVIYPSFGTNDLVVKSKVSKVKIISIIVSEMTKSLRGHYRRFGKRTTEEMGLQTLPENRY